MAALSQKDKTEIVEELQVIASWIPSGPRRTKVLALADRVAGVEIGSTEAATVVAPEDKATEKAKA